MAIYFVLNDSNLKCEKSDIGNIIMNINNELLEKYGLTLNTLAISSLDEYCEIKNGIDSGELEYVTEDLLWKNMSINDKASKLASYFKFSTPIKELLIIDPYFFPKNADEQYFKLLKLTLTKIKSEKAKIVVRRSEYNESFADRIKASVTTEIEVICSNEWHDRFWIADKKQGIIVGASLNGIGRKISSIHRLTNDDISEIFDYLDPNSR